MKQLFEIGIENGKREKTNNERGLQIDQQSSLKDKFSRNDAIRAIRRSKQQSGAVKSRIPQSVQVSHTNSLACIAIVNQLMISAFKLLIVFFPNFMLVAQTFKSQQIIEGPYELNVQFNFIVSMLSKVALILFFMMAQLYNCNLILDPQYLEIDGYDKIKSRPFNYAAFTYSEGSKSILAMREQGILSIYQMNSTGFYNLVQRIDVLQDEPNCKEQQLLVNDDRSKIFINCQDNLLVYTLVNGVYQFYQFYNTSTTGFLKFEQISKDGQYVIWNNHSDYRMISKDMGNNNYIHYKVLISYQTYCFIYDSKSLITFSSDLQLKQYDLSTLFSGSPVYTTFTITGQFSSLIQWRASSYPQVYNYGSSIIFTAGNALYNMLPLLLTNKNGNWEINKVVQYKHRSYQNFIVTSPYGTILLRINLDTLYIYRYNPTKYIYQYQSALKSMFTLDADQIIVNQNGEIFLNQVFLYQITYTQTNSNSPNSNSSGSNGNNGNSNGNNGNSNGATEHKIENNVTFQMDSTWVIIGFSVGNVFLLVLIILIAKLICFKNKQSPSNFNDPAERKELLRNKDQTNSVDSTKMTQFMSVEREKYLNKHFNQIGLGKSLFGRTEVVDLKELIKQ